MLCIDDADVLLIVLCVDVVLGVHRSCCVIDRVLCDVLCVYYRSCFLLIVFCYCLCWVGIDRVVRVYLLRLVLFLLCIDRVVY